MFEHDAFFFIGVFIFIFLVWAATGGPTHPISFTGPFLSAPSPIGGGTYIRLPQAPQIIGGAAASGGGVSGSSASETPAPASGVAFGPPSNYRGEVYLDHSVSGAHASDPEQEYVAVRLSSSAPGPVNLSGWTIESAASGNAAVIPQGTETPTSGVINAIQPIILNPGDEAILISGRSPIGASFRENKCIGYFAQFQTFSPPLPNSCPVPKDELAQFYPDYIRDAACVSYVSSVNRCTLVASPPVGLGSACQNFIITYLNYNGCVQAHASDSNFKNTTWRIYLGRDSSMWRSQYEVARLVDVSGKTVDQFAY